MKLSAHDDPGALQLKPISAITSPKLVDQDSSVNFTVYARDTPGRGNYGDVTYTWQIENANIDFDASPHLELSNNGRTLTVNKLSDYVSKSFSCQMERSTPDKSLDTATSSTMGFRNDDVVIAPKFLLIPLTFFTNYPDLSLVKPGSSLKATPNKAYMMPTAALAGDNPEQLLLKADSFRYYINDVPFSFISDNAENYDNDTNVGITEAKFNEKLPARKNDSKPAVNSSSNVASITPDQAKINNGETYTVICKSGFEPQDAELTCNRDGNLSSQPSCKKSHGEMLSCRRT
ncbi:hypothetical protein ACHWQZ_G003596 [Mnemiopsis leidyi]